MPEPADFVTVEYADGTTRTSLSRLTDGRVMCALCCEYTPRDRLAPDPRLDGCVIDVCLPCALTEARQLAERAGAALREVLAQFTEAGRPGAPCLRTPWIRTPTVERWRAALTPPAPGDHGEG